MSDYTPLYGEIWSDPGWQRLGMPAQWLYVLLKSSPTRNPAGIVEMQPIKWANCADAVTVEQVQDALSELIALGYIEVDDRTQEVMIVGFIETDAVGNPTYYVTTLKAARTCQSAKLRTSLFKAIQQVHPPDLSGWRSEKTREKLQARIDAAYDALATKVQRDAADIEFNPSPVPASVDASVPASATATATRGEPVGESVGGAMGELPARCRYAGHVDRPAVSADGRWCADCEKREQRWERGS